MVNAVSRFGRWFGWISMALLVLAVLPAQVTQAARPTGMVYEGVDEVACAAPANPVVAENCQPGTDEWITQNYAQDIEIFASTDSVEKGEQIEFFVDTNAPRFDLYIYRNGYYGGLGGRLVHSKTGLRGNQQPGCARAEDTGLRTCSNWTVSYTLVVPEEWVSGIYVVRIQRQDTGGENDTLFVVRDDERDSDILYQQSTTTFQAYNNFGGKSLYSWASGQCDTVSDMPRAVKVSFNRPYNQPKDDPNYFFRAEYPMVRWLEQQGYDVTYSTSKDTHRSGLPDAHNELLDHKAFLAVGHDEYWSQGIRDAITAARDAGVNIGLFTANTGYWRVRFEPDPLTQEPDSVMVVYKTTESGPADPSGQPTGTWRDPAGANDPENALNGVMYIGDNDKFYFPLRVTAEQAKDPTFRHTGLDAMPAGSYIDIGDQVIGWEWDASIDNGQAPADMTVLADSPTYGLLLNGSAGRFTEGNVGQAAAQTIRYTAPSGAIVFASGTIQWSWGLGAEGINIVEPDPFISQITYNVLADMGAQPTSPTDNIITDGDSRTPPALPEGAVKTEAAAKPVISNIQTTVNGQDMTITWDTDVEATSQVWYGQPDHVVNTGGLDETYTTSHSLTIVGLDFNTSYALRVVSTDKNWGVTISDESTVTTASPSGIGGQLSNAFSPLVRRGGCWARANTSLLVVMGVGLVVVILIIIAWRFLRGSNVEAVVPEAE